MVDSKFSHLDKKGNARIVNVSRKKKSSRYAKARATVWLSKKILAMIKNDEFKKGNVINVARIAGIMGAKQTSNLIPLFSAACFLNLTIVCVFTIILSLLGFAAGIKTMIRTSKEFEKLNK